MRHQKSNHGGQVARASLALPVLTILNQCVDCHDSASQGVKRGGTHDNDLYLESITVDDGLG
jgi:hypothetical protein